jgi:hypothetical protein
LNENVVHLLNVLLKNGRWVEKVVKIGMAIGPTI